MKFSAIWMVSWLVMALAFVVMAVAFERMAVQRDVCSTQLHELAAYKQERLDADKMPWCPAGRMMWMYCSKDNDEDNCLRKCLGIND